MIEEAILIGFAAWRITALISYERGPFDMLMRFRSVLGFEHDDKGEPSEWPSRTLPRIISCPWCLGLYAVVVMWGIWEWEPKAVMVVAASAVLIAVERWNHA